MQHPPHSLLTCPFSLQSLRKGYWTDALPQDPILLWWKVAGAALKWRLRPAASEGWTGVIRARSRTSGSHRPSHPQSQASHHSLDPAAALLLPPHLLHGHRTMELQAIMSKGPGERTQEGCVVPPHPCLEQWGKDSAPRAFGVLPSLTQHTPVLSNLNQWCEQLDSVWTWGKGGLP